MTRRYRVEIEDAAENDLFEIYRLRLAQRGPDGPDGAEALLDALMETIHSLSDFPERGPVPVELVEFGERTWRQISRPPFRIIYELVDDLVTIVLIADGRRDMSVLLQRRLF